MEATVEPGRSNNPLGSGILRPAAVLLNQRINQRYRHCGPLNRSRIRVNEQLKDQYGTAQIDVSVVSLPRKPLMLIRISNKSAPFSGIAEL